MKVKVKLSCGDVIYTNVSSNSIKDLLEKISYQDNWIITDDAMFRKADIEYIAKTD